MKIGIASLGRTSEDTGGRTYIENFLRTANLMGVEHELVLFLSDDEARRLELPMSKHLEIVSIPGSSRTPAAKVYGEQFALPRHAESAKIDVMYLPGNFGSIGLKRPYVVNIRATAHFYGKQYGIGWQRRIVRSLLMPIGARKAWRIITPSHDIKKDVVRFTGVDESKIEVIPHGVDTARFSPEHRDSVEAIDLLRRLAIEPGNYILYVSALWRYKNQDLLIRAFAAVLQARPDLKLVLAGKGTGTEDDYIRFLHALPYELGIEDRVVFTGQLEHDNLRHLYANALLVAFPSSYESFGNPIFEAWASEVPIVTSNVHAFPEIVGDAGRLFDLGSPDDLERTLVEIATSPRLRNQLVARGRERVKEFTWEKAVQRTVAVLEGVYASSCK